MKKLLFFTFTLMIWSYSCTKENKPLVGTGNKVDISTMPVTGFTSDTALLGGEVKSDGGETISERGICWAIRSQPTISDSFRKVIGGIGPFTISVKTLLPNRQYFVRAFATNKHGTVYGEQKDFTTLTSTATVTTNSVNSITQTTAIASGSVLSDGGSTVTQRGFCWNTQPTPNISNNVLTSGTGVGNFNSSITGLVAGTTYYVRAYATNSRGTS